MRALLLLPFLLLTACGGPTGYLVEDGQVFWAEYSGSTAFMTISRVERPLDADPESFRVERFKVWASDKTSAFYEGERVGDVDQATFGALNKRYAKDGTTVWFRTHLLEEAHAESFRILEDTYTADRRYGFYGQSPFELCDPASVRVLDVGVHPFAVDDLCAFAGSLKIPLEDRSTFERLGGSYSKDSVRVYWRNQVVEGADVATFYVPEGKLYGRDADGCFQSQYEMACSE
ncbi:hypothetical protein HK107_10045 [Parvularcula sp. ZS-1/3]|uniref:Lipoprotein n=1 Tax=Parvularcula mediterranea TaxID=2732508 RepID=A0A7Y3RN55_9PROT|nr:DKNYY domain-containing protein [Parvularcula mediterranea]NNU16661.1 hypothetical protein [Parvularcula mediterranea]